MIGIIGRYALPIVLGIGSLAAIVVSLVLLFSSAKSATPIEFSTTAGASTSAILKIDIEGAVESPGLYTLPLGSRVEDAILVAGGLSADVDEGSLATSINRAQKLVDGGKIFIPSRTSVQKVKGTTTGLISVNSASLTELDTLPGVGAVTAQKIIDSRPYQTLEELVSKKAVGQAVFQNIQDKISL